MAWESLMLVFAYGSLLWNPGFSPSSAISATARGWQRRWCVASTVHRGTQSAPGLVLGLVEGGDCAGVVYEIESCRRDEVAKYLELREMAEAGYRPELIDVATSSGSRQALTYVSVAEARVDAAPDECLQRILRAEGRAGTNVEYAARTFECLVRMGVDLSEHQAGLPRDCVMTILKTRAIRRTVRTIVRSPRIFVRTDSSRILKSESTRKDRDTLVLGDETHGVQHQIDGQQAQGEAQP